MPVPNTFNREVISGNFSSFAGNKYSLSSISMPVIRLTATNAIRESSSFPLMKVIEVEFLYLHNGHKNDL